MKTAMYIGGASPEAVREARKAIMAILSSSNAEAGKMAGLSTLSGLGAPASNVTVSGSQFTFDDSQKTYNPIQIEPVPAEDLDVE